jgi:uncharacterized membrane protein YtjA (UPF0391 family)
MHEIPLIKPIDKAYNTGYKTSPGPIRVLARRLQLSTSEAGGIGPPATEVEINTVSFLKGNIMLGYALAFFIIAIIAAVFGFGGIAAGAAGIAKILFFVFLVLFLASLVMSLVRGKSL